MDHATKTFKTTHNSPKTPGGISKSYLTPIRRVGLSRNWKKTGPSPFVSPLASANNTPVVQTETECRKRKKIFRDDDNPQSTNANEDSSGELTNTSPFSCDTPTATDISMTPSRNLLVKRKSKTLILTNDSNDDPKVNSEDVSDMNTLQHSNNEIVVNTETPKSSNNKIAKVSKLSRTKSKNSNKNYKSPIKIENKDSCLNENGNIKENVCKNDNLNDTCKKSDDKKQKSPNNLSKECVVVIQRKIFKSLNVEKDNEKVKINMDNPVSQVLFDSDSDEKPLSNLNNKEKKSVANKSISIDDDFQETKKNISKVADKTTNDLKNCQTKGKDKVSKNVKPPIKIENTPSSQSSASVDDDDDDDFQFGKKKTILVKKSYEKVTRPLKSKSTGSISQKDIEDIKQRINKKKQLLLAKAMTNETSELRELIKKWQKGCQNAITELLELMKKKMPDKENMEYSEILQILKIPPDLVGYDSENDCFVTPDDATIVLSEFNA